MNILYDESTFTLKNRWLSRWLTVEDGSVYTSEFLLRPYGEWGSESWIPYVWPGLHWPVEAAVFVDDHEHWIGPVRDQNVKEVPYATASFRLESHAIERTRLGERLTLNLQPCRPDVPALYILVHYEIADALPLLICNFIPVTMLFRDNSPGQPLSYPQTNNHLPFDRTRRQPGDKFFLQNQKEDQNRGDGNQSAGHQHSVVLTVNPFQQVDRYGEREFFRALKHDLREN